MNDKPIAGRFEHATERNVGLTLANEELVVETVDHRSTVRVSTRTVREDVAVEENLRSVQADIQRVPIGRYIDTVPAVEQRDGVTIIPVVEEVLVKRLLLREEIHVRQVEEDRVHRETVELRRQEPVAERLDLPSVPGGND